MTARARSAWFARTRSAATLAVAVVLGTLGCKGKQGNSGGGFSKNDPLIGGPSRIPKQNVPTYPGGTARDPNGRTDPLLGLPTSGTRANSGIGYTDDPSRWKNGPYSPGPGDVPAALAGRPQDSDELKMETPGAVGLTPAGGIAAPIARPSPGDAAFGPLAKYGVKRGDYRLSRQNGLYIVQVKVPISEGGPSRGYTGQGATEAAAVQQIIDQIQSTK